MRQAYSSAGPSEESDEGMDFDASAFGLHRWVELEMVVSLAQEENLWDGSVESHPIHLHLARDRTI